MSSRPTFIKQTEHYNVTRQLVREHAATPWVWVEPVAAGGKTHYAVHGANHEQDVPPFAIEVYQEGRLQRYEASNAAVLELASLPETARVSAVRAQMAISQVAERPARAMAMP